MLIMFIVCLIYSTPNYQQACLIPAVMSNQDFCHFGRPWQPGAATASNRVSINLPPKPGRRRPFF